MLIVTDTLAWLILLNRLLPSVEEFDLKPNFLYHAFNGTLYYPFYIDFYLCLETIKSILYLNNDKIIISTISNAP